MDRLDSKIDASVNFATKTPDGGHYESRFVFRGSDYFVCYLSSHSGCSMGCKMCHLTTTAQTMMRTATAKDLMDQARPVLSHAKKVFPNGIPRITFSFMARGEPLLNTYITRNSTETFSLLAEEARQFFPDAMIQFSISTIMPQGTDLVKFFPVIHPKVYFSAYSSNDEVRNSLVPNGMPFVEAANELVRYSLMTKRICTLHGAFIKGVNDNLGDVVRMARYLETGHIGANIVRLNPPEGSGMEEAEEWFLEEVEDVYRDRLSGPVKRIARVGLDVFASCGMFVGKK